MRLLVIQSHRPDALVPWLQTCMASVRDWALAGGAQYRFIDDALFDSVPAELRRTFAAQPVVLADLARLRALQAGLAEGHDAVLWADADVLVFAPRALQLPAAPFALGREHWIQPDGARLRCYSKVHNAFMLFRAGNPFLDFYADAAERMLRRASAPVVPQFIGPKLLGHLHNLVGFPTIEAAAMFSPRVLADVLAGGGEAVAQLRAVQACPPAAANLSASCCGRQVDGVHLGPDDYLRLTQRLLEAGGLPPG